MNLNNKTLDKWLESAPKDEFPGNGKNDYFLMYKKVSEYLNNNVHSEVNIGARITDGGLLTDHGPEHIQTVISRASDLVSADTCELTPYEVYILLTAIHFHDVGNIFGRDEHELKSSKIFKELGPLASIDRIEKHWITRIAETHGGKDKDKLEKLEIQTKILNFPVRVQLLAAILKLADELADEYSRASKLKWEQLPKESQVFHKFAHTLKNVSIDHNSRTIELDFYLDKEEATTMYGKAGKPDAYLIDEIKERTFKTHLERLYCMRFMIPFIRLDRVAVKIQFIEEDQPISFHDPIGYKLEEKGYPQFEKESLEGEFSRLCPEILCTGETIKNEIEASIAATS